MTVEAPAGFRAFGLEGFMIPASLHSSLIIREHVSFCFLGNPFSKSTNLFASAVEVYFDLS